MKKFVILFFLISLHITITNAQTKGSFELMDVLTNIGISKSELKEYPKFTAKVDILEHRVMNVAKYSGSYYTVHYVKHVRGTGWNKEEPYDMPVEMETIEIIGSKGNDKGLIKNVDTTKFLMINSSTLSGFFQVDFDQGVIVLLADEIRFLIKSIDTLKPDLQSYDYSSKIGMKKTIQFSKISHYTGTKVLPRGEGKIAGNYPDDPQHAVFDFGVEVAFYKKDNQPRKIIWFLKDEHGFEMYPDDIDKFRDILEKSLDRMEEF